MNPHPKYDAYILDLHLENSKCQKLFRTRYRHAYTIVWPETVGVFFNENPDFSHPFNIIEQMPKNRIRFWWDDRFKNPTVEIWTKDVSSGAYDNRLALFNSVLGVDGFLLGDEINEKIMDMDLRGDRYRMVDVRPARFPYGKFDRKVERLKNEMEESFKARLLRSLKIRNAR